MLFFSSFFFFLSFSYTFYEGKHQGIQQSLTYPTEEQRNNKKKKAEKKTQEKKENGTTNKDDRTSIDLSQQWHSLQYWNV